MSGIITAAGRLETEIAGKTFSRWTSGTVTRDLKEISGSFELEYLDEGRADAAGVTLLSPPPYFAIVKPLMPCLVKIDGEVILKGHVEDVDLDETGSQLRAKITGRDLTGDLHDCSAAPEGPAEYKALTLLQFATIVCQPFGITVRAETDIGEPFDLIAINPHETALQVLEKLARQRSVLLVSDGVGGLLLTTGGAKRAPDSIERGRNVIATQTRRSTRHRFSDIYVKGQSTHGAGHRKPGKSRVALDSSVTPYNGAGAAVPPVPTPTSSAGKVMRTNATAGTLMTGHAKDPEIDRWRPHVRLTRTQSGMSSTQEQAEWAVRVARGEGDDIHYFVEDWRAGDGTLWRPNEVAAVYDPWSDVDNDMLIAGVRYEIRDAHAVQTALRVVGVTAYDRINEADRRRHPHGRHGRKKHGGGGPLDASVPGIGPS